jgi:hypothetical protein
LADPFRLREALLMPNVPQAWPAAPVSWALGFAQAPPAPPGGRAPGAPTLRPLLGPGTTGGCRRRRLAQLRPLALPRRGALRRVGREPTARGPRAVGCLLARLGRASFGRLDATAPLAPAPGDARGAVCGGMPPAGLARLATPPRATPSRVGPARLGVALVPREVGHVIRCHRACSWSCPIIPVKIAVGREALLGSGKRGIRTLHHSQEGPPRRPRKRAPSEGKTQELAQLLRGQSPGQDGQEFVSA